MICPKLAESYDGGLLTLEKVAAQFVLGRFVLAHLVLYPAHFVLNGFSFVFVGWQFYSYITVYFFILMAAADEETVILTTKRRELFLFDRRLFRIVDENQNNLSVYYKCNTNPSVKCGGRLKRKRRIHYREIEARIERVKSEFIAQQRTALDYVKNISYLMR